ncbi:pentatricopeptide repeat-containing protein At2g35030, mitochondrial-like [Magnolia sinica]|uniref:pentatricopeptide repeat-containing protein At2g35030, mitochondrial-like n=1 Tax=Magnolia sinica TaxID=86752 RepID=UPI0026593639|nr:pentatricopeptide repeat-containing protein At2g35030, mitochondrial-like [Magnolia sinica]
MSACGGGRTCGGKLRIYLLGFDFFFFQSLRYEMLASIRSPPLLCFLLHVKNLSKSSVFPSLLPLVSLSNLCPSSRTHLADDAIIFHSRNLHCSSSLPPRISTSQRDVSLDQNIARSNWMINQLSREGKISDARRLFDEMPERDVVTWTALISGYIKCGLIKEARRLFDESAAKKNVVTWTALLAGYFRFKQIEDAERLFAEMPERNVVSWNTMLSGYAKNGCVDSAYDLFQKMPERNVVSWNTIITALGQEGRIEEAWRLFYQMPVRDVISWTAMVAGLSQNGRIDEARNLFDQMPERNVVSWNAMIAGYAQNLRLDEAFYLFERMPERDLPSWNAMITGFIQNGDLRRARKLFNEMQERNVVTWTSLITGYVQDGQSEEAMKIFSRMLNDGIKPNQGTFVSVLSACSSLAGLGEGKQIHQIINKTIFQFNTFVESALISMYAKCGEISIAREMFDRSNQKDLISWNGMIAAYAHHGYGREAICLFDEMRENGFKPDDVTYVGVLSACSHSGLVDEGMEYFNELMRNPSIEVREDHYACLVDLCGRAGRLEEAVEFIGRLKNKPSACVWGALLGGCSVHGNVRIGKHAAKQLLEVEPTNTGTYLLLSNIYASAGRWKEAAKVRLKMKDQGLKKQPGCSWIEVGNRVHVFVVGDKSHGQAKEIYYLLQDLYQKMKKAGYVPKKDYRVNHDFLVI